MTAAEQMQTDLVIAAPSDATEVFGWTQHGPGLARRPFTGTVRAAAGFAVRIEGFQRENRTCLRRVVVDAASLSTRLDPEAVRQLASSSARPAPDHVWRQALTAADARTTLILRLAGEAGLRRAEIAQVHHRDLVDGVDGTQLLVHGKGGKPRVIPITDSLADVIRNHGAQDRGWLFPNGQGGHLAPDYVGEIAQRVLTEGWTLHTCRHRFATRAYRVQGICGPCRPCWAIHRSRQRSGICRLMTVRSARRCCPLCREPIALAHI